ncbi:MFS transporter [Desulfitobacterium dichloroeliminans]|nr:MFS transporter [Desulfitobacterium dichloroeliminans]
MSKSGFSKYRWGILILLILLQLASTFNWLGPSPLLTTIKTELTIDYSSAGSLMSIISLMLAFFMFAGSFIIDRFGATKAMILSAVLAGLGGVGGLFVRDYLFLMITRIAIGAGLGIGTPAASVLIYQWFPPKEHQFVNSLYTAMGYLSMAIAFMITIPLFVFFGSWRVVLSFYGACALVLAVVWMVLLHCKSELSVIRKQTKVKKQSSVNKQMGLSLALKKKEVWLLFAAHCGAVWTFQGFMTFLPSFFQQVKGLDIATASSITGFMPLIGAFGSIACGIVSSAIGLRKPFTWPMHLLMVLGGIGCIVLPFGPLLYLSVGVFGFGMASWFSVMITIPMELEGATAEFVGGAMAVIIGISNLVVFAFPVAYSAIPASLGECTSMLIFTFIPLLSALGALFLPETGWRKLDQKQGQ